jgi:hypothetical protein
MLLIIFSIALFVVAVKKKTFLFNNYHMPANAALTALKDELYKIKSYSFTIIIPSSVGYS